MAQAFIEFSLLAIGMYALITGRLPNWIIGSNNAIEKNIVRRIGILFVMPLPFLLCLGMVISLFQADIKQFFFVEPIFMFAIIVLGGILINRYRKPVEINTILDDDNQE